MHRKNWRNIKIYTLSLLGVFFLFSCSDKDNYEVVDAEKVLPQAKRDYSNKEEKQQSEDTLQLSELEQKLKKGLPHVQFNDANQLQIDDTRLLPNQLGYKEKRETYFSIDSIPYHFVEWSFKDSAKTVNAFYNWLDCFGNDCRSIKIDEEKNGSKQAFIAWVSNTNISYLESAKRIKIENWDPLLFNKNGAWIFIIRQAPNSNINWLKSPSESH